MEFDVYGRIRVRVVENRGPWRTAYAVRSNGRLHRLDDVVVPADATVEDIVAILEAVFHEAGEPGAEIRRVR